jgi:glycosyltransferase involved in cell wall biosynthesis
MKILILNTYDHGGGAAKGAFNLFDALSKFGADVEFGVQSKIGNDPRIIGINSYGWTSKIRSKIDSAFSKLHHPQSIFSTPWVPFSSMRSVIDKIQPDIINLHWVNGGFFNIRSLTGIKTPIVWTLHDSWPFTGGCHLPINCANFENNCGNCPNLNSKIEIDLSRKIHRAKSETYSNLNLSFVTPSEWLFKNAKRSSLLNVRSGAVIPNPVNTSVFKQQNKNESRKKLNLPTNSKIVGFGAMGAFQDRIKGGQFIPELISNLPKDTYFCFFGSSVIELPVNKDRCRFFGTIQNEEMISSILSASDAIVVPSLTENLSYMILESLCVNTPVIAFNVGGNPELITHLENGYLAQPFEVESLISGVNWALENCPSPNFKKDRFEPEKVAKEYLNFFNSVII